jgi:CheY-like chemotaxis protein
VAYHIRLSGELSLEQRCLPIVIISDIDIYVLNKLSSLSGILFTKNVFTVKNDIASVKNFNIDKITPLIEEEYQSKFLNQIEVKQPKDYLSHHSIANEWSIYRWGEFLKIDSDSLSANKEKISSMLYFKYLLAKNPIETTKGITFAPKAPNLSGEILYIDDQWNQGWGDIFDRYFSKSKNIQFTTFEYEYKDKNKITVLEDIKNKIIKRMPDLVILDLRLIQTDHNDIKIDQDIEALTGIKVLNIIKEINRGIQVVMITASNQTLILEKLYDFGILGYIKKEHPKDISISTKDNFTKLKKYIDDGLEKKFLKKIWTIQHDLLKINIFSDAKMKDIRFEISSVFAILDSKIEEKYDFVIFTFTKVLESISSIYINEYKMQYIDDGISVGIYDHQQNKIYDYDNEKWYKNIQNRLHNILYEKLGFTQKSIHVNICELINCRNYIAHPNERTPSGCKLIKNPKSDDIIRWFEMISMILNKI